VGLKRFHDSRGDCSGSCAAIEHCPREAMLYVDHDYLLSFVQFASKISLAVSSLTEPPEKIN